MKNWTLIPITLLTMLLFALPALVLAPSAQAEIPRVLSIQGVLTDADGEIVADDQYSTVFQLFHGPTGGEQVWEEDIELYTEDGIFSTVLTLSPASYYDWISADRLWLEITIYGEDPMLPRIPLTAAPYALRAAVADSLVGGGGGGSPWVITGNDVYYDTGNVGIGTTTPAHALQVVSDGERAIFGDNTATSGAAYGVYGQSASTSGRSLWGMATATSGYTYGVYGRSCSNSGRAVYGNASAPTGYTHGVSGQSWSSTGRGVNGLASAASGINYGIYGETYSPDGFAGYFMGGKSYFQGNVGIGIQTPAAKLHIGGTPNVDGIMFPDGTLQKTAATGGGADDDWVIDNDDIYHEDGRVYIGITPGGGKPASREGDKGDGRDPSSSKMIVHGINEGIYSLMDESDASSDGRSGIFGQRDRNQRNDGSGFGVNQTNTAITGYNTWGDSYTFGVAGYTWFDLPHTAGILGSSYNGDYWGALAYMDDSSTIWGMYTPSSAHIGGTAEVAGLRLTTGATAGHVLTGDSSGNASWQPPSAAVSDDDWVIQGYDLTHAGPGVIAIGTDTPIPLITEWAQPTLQVSALYNPALVLDKTSGTFTRWSIYQTGSPGILNFGRSETAGVPEHPTLTLGDYQMEVKDSNGNTEVTITGNHLGTNDGRIITPVLEITGGSDLSEQFDIEAIGQHIEPGMVVSIDPERPGRLTLSSGAYDRRVAGVISGAGGVKPGMLMGQRGSVADGELPVALVGRVYVWADAAGSGIEPGDLLTTADRPGHAMRVENLSQAAGAILGKAMTGLDDGQGLVLVLVSLQ